MRVLLLLLLAALAGNIYQYRRQVFFSKKYKNLRVSASRKFSEMKGASRKARRGSLAVARKYSAQNSFSRRCPCEGKGGSARSESQGNRVSGPEWDSPLLEEVQEQWREKIKTYFTEELLLSEEDFVFYQEVLRELEEGVARAKGYFSTQEENDEILGTFSLEEQKALLYLRESAMKRLSEKFGQEKLGSLFQYEQDFQDEVFREIGVIYDFGFN